MPHPFQFDHLALTRRELLHRCGMGFGALALGDLIVGAQRATAASTDPLTPHAPHFAAKAKRVIHIFLNGGPSHVDTFDPKPSLTKYNGQLMPGGDKKGEPKKLMASPFAFNNYGQSGIEVSDLFPHVGSCIDDVCVIRSMYTDLPSHPQAILQMSSGHIVPGFPSMGSWLTYGLGTENQNLPGFIAMCPGMPNVGPQLWSSGFLPAAHQGTYVPCDETDADRMIQYLTSKQIKPSEQRRELDFIKALNRLDLERRGPDSQLEGRIEAMEMAYRMQNEALDAFDVTKESAATLSAYGVP